MRRLIYGMNASVDGFVAAPGDDLSWSAPGDDVFRWWLEQEQANTLMLYGRRLWENMSSYWPDADQQPGAPPEQAEFARNWRETPKVVFSSSLGELSGNARAFSGDAVAEIARLRAGDGGPMTIGGATLAAAAVNAGLVDEFRIVTHPVLLGGGCASSAQWTHGSTWTWWRPGPSAGARSSPDTRRPRDVS